MQTDHKKNLDDSVPKQWKIVKLIDIVKVVKGRKPSEIHEKRSENDIPYLTADVLRNENLDPFWCNEGSNIVRINENDTLMIWDGAYAGDVFFGSGGALASTMVKVMPISNDLDKKFLYYILKNNSHYLRSKTYGSTIPHISRSIFRNIPIPLPPLSEQKALAKMLTYLNALEDRRARSITVLNHLLQSIFIKMFGDPKVNAKHWNVVKLKEVCTKISDGTHKTPKYDTEGIPFLSVQNVRPNIIKLDKIKYISKEEHEFLTRNTKPEIFDILYTKVGATYGYAAVIENTFDFSIFVSLALIKPKKEVINPYFLSMVMNLPYVKEQADRRIKGIAVPDLHLEEIREFEIVLPPLNLQQKFEVWSKTIKSLQKKQLESEKQIQLLVASITYRLFKGEIDLSKIDVANINDKVLEAT